MKLDGTHKKKTCPNCGKDITVANFERHYNACVNGYKNKKVSVKSDIKVTDDMICPFCGKKAKNNNSYSQHYIRCKNNPSRIKNACRDYKAQYANLSQETKDKMVWNKGLTKETNESIKSGATKRLGTHNTNYENNIYKEYNQEQIQQWFDYIKDIEVVHDYDTIGHNEGYRCISKNYLREGSSIKLKMEHNYIANILLNNKLPELCTVHHIDKNPSNNDKFNLMVFETNGDHKRYHNSKYAKLIYNPDTHLFACIMDKSCE